MVLRAAPPRLRGDSRSGAPAARRCRWRAAAAERPGAMPAGESRAPSRSALESLTRLDALLPAAPTGAVGEPSEAAAGGGGEPRAAWWAAPAAQDAAPRKYAMPAGKAGAFISEDFIIKPSTAAGRLTEPGDAPDVPLSAPWLAYAASAAAAAASPALLAATGGGVAGGGGLADVVGAAPLVAAAAPADAAHAALAAWALASLGATLEARLGAPWLAAVGLLSAAAAGVAEAALAGGVASAPAGLDVPALLLGALSGFASRNPSLGRPSAPALANAAALAAALGGALFLDASSAVAAAVAAADADSLSGTAGAVAGGLARAVGPALVAAAAGRSLAAACGPRFATTYELVIPDGSMSVPDGAREVAVVVDQTSTLGRAGAAASFAARLALAGACVALASASSPTQLPPLG